NAWIRLLESPRRPPRHRRSNTCAGWRTICDRRSTAGGFLPWCEGRKTRRCEPEDRRKNIRAVAPRCHAGAGAIGDCWANRSCSTVASILQRRLSAVPGTAGDGPVRITDHLCEPGESATGSRLRPKTGVRHPHGDRGVTGAAFVAIEL